MASDVDICNAALGELGVSGLVTSLAPPTGTAYATLCATLYPMARDSLLEMHTWTFATKRVSLALLSETPPNSWSYAYAAPTDALNFLAVLDPDATDDYSQGLVQYGNIAGIYPQNVGVYTTKPYETETDASGNVIVYTNQTDAVLRYTGRVTDTTKFSPMFTESLVKLLKSKLAGPVIKGEEGRQEMKSALAEFGAIFGKATASDANQHRTRVAQSTDWIVNR